MWQEKAERQWNVDTGDKEMVDIGGSVPDSGTEVLGISAMF